MARKQPTLCRGGCGKLSKYAYCSACKKKRERESNLEGYLARKQRARDEKFKRGLCMYCNVRRRKSKRYCEACLQKLAAQMQRDRQKIRSETIRHYGGICECCGEDRLEFLTLDHVNGGGNAHRRALKASGTNLYRKLKNLGWPAGFRVLCWNCNCAIGLYSQQH